MRGGTTIGGRSYTRVRDLLKETSAYGEYKVHIKGGKSYSFSIPPVVSRETFEQAIKVSSSRTHFKNRTSNRNYLISPRKGRCGECGHRFHLESRSSRVKKRDANGDIKTYFRKELAPSLLCWGMLKYPHIHNCRERKYVDFDAVQTIVLRKVSEVLSSDDFALACTLPNKSQVQEASKKLKEAKEALEQVTREINFVVTEGRTGKIPKSVFDLQMAQLNEVLEYRQERAQELESEYQNADDKVKKAEKIVPIVALMKGFWSLFKAATVSSNNNKVFGIEGKAELPLSHENLKDLKNMLDTLVEEYTIDKDNKVTIKLSIPILEDIKEDADSCRQLLPSP